jgi:Holliday junction resolvase RusA-like endonuclease
MARGWNMQSLDKVRVENRPISDRGPVSVTVPMPPSVNNLFATTSDGGRRRSGRYNQWRETAGNMVNASRMRRIAGPVAIAIRLEEPNNRADIDNFAKTLIDLLVWMSVIDGDDSRTVRKLTMEWANVQGAQITVAPHEAFVRAA